MAGWSVNPSFVSESANDVANALPKRDNDTGGNSSVPSSTSRLARGDRFLSGPRTFFTTPTVRVENLVSRDLRNKPSLRSELTPEHARYSAPVRSHQWHDAHQAG